MRRADRQVRDIDQIKEILDQCKVCRVAFYDGRESYLVPLNYGYEMGDKLVLYFHGAPEGRKIDIIRSGFTQVCVEMDCEHSLIEGETACAYGYRFASIIGNGTAWIVEDIPEKIKGLKCLMRHQTGCEFEFDAQMAGAVTVFRIVVEEFTAKRHL